MLIDTIILFVLVIISVSYSVLMVLLFIGWMKIKPFHAIYTSKYISATVIIPVKNEAENIENCINSILNQSYETEKYEIIVVNDYSTDTSFKKALELSKNHSNIRLFDLKNLERKPGKKSALKLGIEKANGKLIVTTDADCTFDKDWLKTINRFYIEYRPDMIICPVTIKSGKGIFNSFQELEFSSLQASTAGATGVNIPFMCNGANLAFTKHAFQEVNGYAGNEGMPSGDDVFLLHKIKKHFGNKKILYLKSPKVIAITDAPNTIKSFYKQRIRWASKAKSYKSKSAVFTSLIIFFYSFSVITLFLLGLFYNKFLLICCLMLLIKLLVDFPLLLVFNKFQKRSNLLLYYFPLQLIYPIYILIIGIISLFSKNKWD